MNFTLNRSAQRREKKAQVGGHADLALDQRNIAVDAATFEMKGISSPAVFDVKAFGDLLGYVLYRLPGFFHGFRMLTPNFDAWHGFCLFRVQVTGILWTAKRPSRNVSFNSLLHVLCCPVLESAEKREGVVQCA